MGALAKALAQLRDEFTPPGELVRIIDQLEHQYSTIEDLPKFLRTGQAPNVKEFRSGNGIAALVHVATAGWPADGNLATSKHPYDTVKDVGAAAVQYERDSMPSVKGVSKAGPKWRSPRRRAIVCLSMLGHYKPYLNEMERVGFFNPDALPAMLESSFAHIDYSLHNKGFEFFHAKDQTQTVVVSLLNLTASGIMCSETLLEQCTKHTAMAICKLYKDPFQIWVDKCHAERQLLAARHRSKGWSEKRISNAVHDLKQKQQQKEDRCGWTDECFFELGGLDYNVVRFFNTLIKHSTEDDLLQLIHRGGLITLLKGCVSQRHNVPRQDSPEDAIDTLTELWTKKAAEVSKDLYKRIEAEEAQALDLRQQGNDAFKAGQLQQALNYYWQAVEHNPQDYALFNNISLVALKMGDPKQALRAAEESIRVVPTVYKSWVRMGDAFRAIKRWQLAHLAYSCARELAPHDEDVKGRQEEARGHLEDVWAIEDVPRFAQHDPADAMSTMFAAFQWMGISRNNPMEITTLMMGDRSEGGAAHNMLNKHMLTVASSGTGMIKASIMTLGTPGLHSVRRVLMQAMLNPLEKHPGRPRELFVAHRMFPLVHKIGEMCRPWGFAIAAETATEAAQTSKNQDTHADGYNHEGEYRDEGDDHTMFHKNAKDPNNGHKKT